jgi:hypothetical protein
MTPLLQHFSLNLARALLKLKPEHMLEWIRTLKDTEMMDHSHMVARLSMIETLATYARDAGEDQTMIPSQDSAEEFHEKLDAKQWAEDVEAVLISIIVFGFIGEGRL